MERVIHRFPVQDDAEIHLVMLLEPTGPRIEWRRCRIQGNGAMVVHERFPIRLAWIPGLVEGLIHAEDNLRDIELGVTGEMAKVPGPGTDGAALIILPDQRPPPITKDILSAPEPELDPSMRISGRFPRFGIRAPLIVAVQGKDLAGPKILTGDAVDISWGGLQALLPSKLPSGTVLEILVGLGGKKALKLPARVVWGRTVPGLGQGKPHGLEFLPADFRLRQLIEQYIVQLAHESD